MNVQYWHGKMLLALAAVMAAVTGCTKEQTNFYADGQENGLAIFSNTGNNLMTGYVNGVAWQTEPRARTALFSTGRRYEIMVLKRSLAAGLKDTINFEWSGNTAANGNNQGTVSLSLIVPKGFGYKDFNVLQGKRITVNVTDGYFSTDVRTLNPLNTKGTGAVYFHTASLDSVAPGYYSGRLSGLVEADFNGNKLTRGRFDHQLENDQVFF